jgi:hypothetical protein
LQVGGPDFEGEIIYRPHRDFIQVIGAAWTADDKIIAGSFVAWRRGIGIITVSPADITAERVSVVYIDGGQAAIKEQRGGRRRTKAAHGQGESQD